MSERSIDPELPPRPAWALEQCRTLHRHCSLAVSRLEPVPEHLERLLARFDRLLEQLGTLSVDYEHQGREVLTAIQSQLPEVWPLVDRELLWFFGGDCLHFLADEEIAAFQAREDGEQ